MKIVIGITGASGSIYAKRLITWLLDEFNVVPDVVFSENGYKVWSSEIGDDELLKQVNLYSNSNMFAPFASGSNDYDGMVIIPASMGTIGRIANGISDSLLTRSADVMLKEKKKLILVPRETPLNLIHIRNLEQLILSGAVILPAMPAFYFKPSTIEELVDFIVIKVLRQLGLPVPSEYNWKGV